MGFAQTVDSFVKLLETAPKPPASGKRKLPASFDKPIKLSATVKGVRKTHEFKMPAHAVKLASTKSASAAAVLAYAQATTEHTLAVVKAFGALTADEKKKLTTLGNASGKSPLAKDLKAARSRGPAGLTAAKLKKGLELAKSQKVNLEASVW